MLCCARARPQRPPSPPRGPRAKLRVRGKGLPAGGPALRSPARPGPGSCGGHVGWRAPPVLLGRRRRRCGVSRRSSDEGPPGPGGRPGPCRGRPAPEGPAPAARRAPCAPRRRARGVGRPGRRRCGRCRATPWFRSPPALRRLQRRRSRGARRIPEGAPARVRGGASSTLARPAA